MLSSGSHQLWASSQPPDTIEDFPKEPLRHGYFGHLKYYIPCMSYDLGSDLDQLISVSLSLSVRNGDVIFNQFFNKEGKKLILWFSARLPLKTHNAQPLTSPTVVPYCGDRRIAEPRRATAGRRFGGRDGAVAADYQRLFRRGT